MQNSVKIGMFGYDCAGQGLHDVLLSSSGFRSDIKKICVKDHTKPRRISADHFTFDKHDILDDPEINLVVEPISDAGEAHNIVKNALISGKNVVTANKRMLATHLPELIQLQEKHNITSKQFLFNVENEYNGVIAEAAFSNQQFFYGKGAGGHPTGSAVLSDISANSYGYRYEYKKLFQHNETTYTRDVDHEVYVRYHHEAALEHIGLTPVSESFKGKEFNYIICITNLDKLFQNRLTLQKLDLFIARTPGKGV